MKKLLVTVAICLLSVLMVAAAKQPGDHWASANSFYVQKNYDSAAAHYEQIARLAPQNATLYFNLGNTYYRLNNIPMAVLNYERALRINPDYKAAAENLALAHNRITNHIAETEDIFFVNWWHSLTSPRMADTWAIAALLLFLLVIGLQLGKLFQVNAVLQIPPQVSGIALLLCCSLLGLGYKAAANKIAHGTAVVMEQDTPLMNSTHDGKPLVLVPEGTTVKIRNEKGGWVEVNLPDGRVGWLQSSFITKI